jgi:hypothetical protein
VSNTCESCAVLERWLRDLKLEIEIELSKRELGFGSPRDERISQQLLDEARKAFAETEVLYKQHRRKHEPI